MKISIIAAMARNRVIGKDNRLPWRIPADLRFFKETTMGHTLVMGRKTYESLQKFLEGRRIIVLTRDSSFQAGEAETAASLEKAIIMAGDEEELFIAGGAEIYALAISRDLVDTMYLTLVHDNFDGDTWFPEFPETDWKLASREDREKDEKNPYDFSFLKYSRVR